MARTTVSSTPKNTYRGYEAQTSSSGGGYDAAAAARAAEEAARQKRIQEQQAIIAEVEKLKSEVSDAYTDLLNAQNIIGNNITGEYAKSISKEINKALDNIEQTVNDLNAIGTKAAENIRSDGQACTYNALHLEANRNAGTSVAFSCDTDALREQVLPYLKNAERKLTNASSSSSKLLKLVGSGTGSNVSPGIDDGKTVIKGAYEQVEEFINNIEQKERENKELVDKLLNNPVVDTGKTILADFWNTGGAFWKGVANVGESVFDALVILGAASANSGTYVGGEFVPYEAGKQGLTDEAWELVMGFVADDHVENAYKGFYENTSAGKWLDENANEPFKSGGTATQIASGLGEVVGIAGLTIATGGSQAVIAGTAGFGKYTEEYWGDARDNAKEGEEWATEETRNKGIAYGAASGAWEATQWYVGGNLNKWSWTKGDEIVDSAFRVVIDTGFNTFDTPYRAMVDAVTSDKTFQEAFEDRGGITSMVTDIGVGLVGSVGGEVVDKINLNNISSEIIKLYDSNNRYDSINNIASYLENKTDVAYNKETFRKYQYELFENLRTNMGDETAGIEVARVFEKIIEDRGGYVETKNIDGIKINVIKGMQLENSKLDKKIQQFVKEMPANLKKCVQEINISDLYNPHDPYWSARYQMKKFTSAATGGNGEIDIYQGDVSIGTLWHESGHCLDSKIHLSDKMGWYLATVRDDIIEGREMVTPYAEQAYKAAGTYKEDFADSVKLFFKDKEKFEKMYPNRYEILKKYINDN